MSCGGCSCSPGQGLPQNEDRMDRVENWLNNLPPQQQTGDLALLNSSFGSSVGSGASGGGFGKSPGNSGNASSLGGQMGGVNYGLEGAQMPSFNTSSSSGGGFQQQQQQQACGRPPTPNQQQMSPTTRTHQLAFGSSPGSGNPQQNFSPYHDSNLDESIGSGVISVPEYRMPSFNDTVSSKGGSGDGAGVQVPGSGGSCATPVLNHSGGLGGIGRQPAPSFYSSSYSSNASQLQQSPAQSQRPATPVQGGGPLFNSTPVGSQGLDNWNPPARNTNLGNNLDMSGMSGGGLSGISSISYASSVNSEPRQVIGDNLNASAMQGQGISNMSAPSFNSSGMSSFNSPATQGGACGRSPVNMNASAMQGQGISNMSAPSFNSSGMSSFNSPATQGGACGRSPGNSGNASGLGGQMGGPNYGLDGVQMPSFNSSSSSGGSYQQQEYLRQATPNQQLMSPTSRTHQLAFGSTPGTPPNVPPIGSPQQNFRPSLNNSSPYHDSNLDESVGSGVISVPDYQMPSFNDTMSSRGGGDAAQSPGSGSGGSCATPRMDMYGGLGGIDRQGAPSFYSSSYSSNASQLQQSPAQAQRPATPVQGGGGIGAPLFNSTFVDNPPQDNWNPPAPNANLGNNLNTSGMSGGGLSGISSISYASSVNSGPRPTCGDNLNASAMQGQGINNMSAPSFNSSGMSSTQGGACGRSPGSVSGLGGQMGGANHGLDSVQMPSFNTSSSSGGSYQQQQQLGDNLNASGMQGQGLDNMSAPSFNSSGMSSFGACPGGGTPANQNIAGALEIINRPENAGMVQFTRQNPELALALTMSRTSQGGAMPLARPCDARDIPSQASLMYLGSLLSRILTERCPCAPNNPHYRTCRERTLRGFTQVVAAAARQAAADGGGGFGPGGGFGEGGGDGSCGELPPQSPSNQPELMEPTQYPALPAPPSYEPPPNQEEVEELASILGAIPEPGVCPRQDQQQQQQEDSACGHGRGAAHQGFREGRQENFFPPTAGPISDGIGGPKIKSFPGAGTGIQASLDGVGGKKCKGVED